jgi:hypothetical protein
LVLSSSSYNKAPAPRSKGPRSSLRLYRSRSSTRALRPQQRPYRAHGSSAYTAPAAVPVVPVATPVTAHIYAPIIARNSGRALLLTAPKALMISPATPSNRYCRLLGHRPWRLIPESFCGLYPLHGRHLVCSQKCLPGRPPLQFRGRAMDKRCLPGHPPLNFRSRPLDRMWLPGQRPPKV